MHKPEQSSEPLKLYSVPEVLDLTGLSRSKLYELIRRKLLRARKIGRRTVVTAADLQAFVDGLQEVA